MTMSREEALAELSALRSRRQAYAVGVANPSPERQHALHDAALLEAVLAVLSAPARMFPIQPERGAKAHPTRIPWWLADMAYSVYAAEFGTSQSLEELARRGGFSPGEMDSFVPDWRARATPAAPAPADLDGPRPTTALDREYVKALDTINQQREALDRLRAVVRGVRKAYSGNFATSEGVQAFDEAFNDLFAFPLPEVPDGK